MRNLRTKIKHEVEKLSIDYYWGTEEQISNEIDIINRLKKIGIDTEMEDRETVVDFYIRILRLGNNRRVK